MISISSNSGTKSKSPELDELRQAAELKELRQPAEPEETAEAADRPPTASSPEVVPPAAEGIEPEHLAEIAEIAEGIELEPPALPEIDESLQESGEVLALGGTDGELPAPDGPSQEVALPRLSEIAVVEPAAPEPAEDPFRTEELDSLDQLSRLLNPLLSRSNAHRKSFELVFRLLKQRKTVPPAMLQSMHPFLFDVMNMLIPQLNDMNHLNDFSAGPAASLFEYCTFLCDRHLSADQVKNDVPITMERVLRLLDGLHGAARQLSEDLSAG